MECMCALTRPQFMLLSERVWGNGVRTHVNSKEKSPVPEKNSHLGYSGPGQGVIAKGKGEEGSPAWWGGGRGMG